MTITSLRDHLSGLAVGRAEGLHGLFQVAQKSGSAAAARNSSHSCCRRACCTFHAMASATKALCEGACPWSTKALISAIKWVGSVNVTFRLSPVIVAIFYYLQVSIVI
jgi:hypothetical protein